MKKNLPTLETCVYVVGSTKLQNPRSDEICRAIGLELSKLKNVTLVTSGFYGAGDTVAKTFYENVDKSRYSQRNVASLDSAPVVHILPLKDSGVSKLNH